MNFKYFLVPLMAIMIISCNAKKGDVGTSVEKETPVIPADYDPEKKLKELGITLSEASAPVANYVNAVRSGNLIFLSGKGPLQSNGENIEGKVGTDLTIEEGYEAAKITGINQLSVLKSELGNLNKVVRVVKVLGMVNAGPDFPDHPKVINGYSDLMVAVFGERGKHARAAVGMGSLPGNIAVEIEMIVEVMPE
ncbi:RidA family protein [Arenibacter troitsensis]|uniref:Enamine deaminase RidA, house cleaning of reactive enamine intermediates, YjgF/YER057c/UK114 family n=1 Tax=Arenibacter troitsensis TaxID=188872 RepID=A0A1X7L9J3_9FLAO|nr:RidA family protein [Arenibacter troitsensis]SMG50073.1 Enamine deaminase RidA, house cleaning of reactive enamine intermediates, YjgF/YER057c/UK114 family [Arenibacter troitsensis]